MDRLKPLIIVGAGGLGREVAWLVEDLNKVDLQWEFLGFLDDGVTGPTVEGYPVLGSISTLLHINPIPWVVVAITNSAVRKRIITRIQQNDIPLATLVHPSIHSSGYVTIGKGSIVCAGSVLTTNIELGLASVVNPNCFIGHDTVLQDYVSLMPGVHVAGEVTLGEGTYMGIHSCIINRMEIGEWSTIGAGATVVNDIPAHSLAVGVPARVIKNL